ncbi:tRNA (adenosine(37)-N6)-dimethylallyltransferase MiaA [Dyadobacter chenwenxiniae]|uniref:tRNA dimethylallyltransferase n=1 Tax=Dyadobacter chenwenxiniae TaxID=2906456 RepID=A0A9X1TM72_9BACT|nr:tRNA (adenosine(37)-N6)-dimethylallyltransferase MiaA [Dyadobacter chenwenxiniae]MCF0063178.1 tRNA (adenosine(37)-N6)-dimethylallyltransferase MiaA [Dyadobacter chenwenxiniae]UON84654.1 tRNA (adenosine(37)-N6)-dimethylallyltransferase MiaA [Dyadobacter chenwenxiniae]
MSHSKPPMPLILILGPTASGKTHLAVKLAAMLGGEIISADSRQIYRDMDIGTGKDLAEYELDGKKIPHYLIDIREAGEQYNVNEFQRDFENAYNAIAANGHVPILCGGTGFYMLSLLKGHAYAAIPVNEPLRAELENISKESLLTRFESYNTAYQHIADTSTRKRLIRAIEISEFLMNNADAETFPDKQAYDYIAFGLNPSVEIRRERISNRLRARLEEGLIDEVKRLLSRGLRAEQLIYYGLEYKWITLYLTGELSYDEMVTRLETEIHRFAKRQMTFFRKMEKDGIRIHWLDNECSAEEHAQVISAHYQQYLTNK